MADTPIAGRYRLDSLLGRTAMSEVWRATDLELDRQVALKLLAPNADTARFEREARAVASLAHPNVTQLYDYGDHEGRPYMVLEYLPGGTLEERLGAREPLPDDDAGRIAADVAAGLAHAHARDVVHRDLKPANVLFDEEGRAKLADFGIARLAAGEGTLTEAGTVLGTATYISPEQAAGAPATPASDVYSFGVLLYRMLTGRLPFESSDPAELIALHRDAPVPPLADIRDDAPARLEATATAALAKDPRDRPPDGRALLDELGVAGAGLTTTGAGAADATRVIPGAAPPPRPPRGRRRPALIVGGLLAFGLAGGAVAYEVTHASSDPTPATTGPLPTFPKQTTHRATTTPAATTLPATTAPTTTTQPATRTTRPATTADVVTVVPPTPPEPVPPTPPATTETVPTDTTPTTTAAETTSAPPPATTTSP